KRRLGDVNGADQIDGLARGVAVSDDGGLEHAAATIVGDEAEEFRVARSRGARCRCAGCASSCDLRACWRSRINQSKQRNDPDPQTMPQRRKVSHDLYRRPGKLATEVGRAVNFVIMTT